jgi:hypothetical protein
LVHHRPHGLAALPRRPGYLYVRPHNTRSLMAFAKPPRSQARPDRLLRGCNLSSSANCCFSSSIRVRACSTGRSKRLELTSSSTGLRGSTNASRLISRRPLSCRIDFRRCTSIQRASRLVLTVKVQAVLSASPRVVHQVAAIQQRSTKPCGLTCRSTGGATAGQPGRATALVHHRPHGPAVLPRRPGYLYVRRRSTRASEPFSSFAGHGKVLELHQATLVAILFLRLAPRRAASRTGTAKVLPGPGRLASASLQHFSTCNPAVRHRRRTEGCEPKSTRALRAGALRRAVSPAGPLEGYAVVAVSSTAMLLTHAVGPRCSIKTRFTLPRNKEGGYAAASSQRPHTSKAAA